MLRMTPAQYAQFERATARTPAKVTAAPRPKKPRAELPENILEKQIGDFLRAHGWTLTRNHVGKFVPLSICTSVIHGFAPAVAMYSQVVTINSAGIPDWTATRAAPRSGGRLREAFDYETKAPGQKPEPHQLAYLHALASKGFLAAWFDTFDEDWETSFLPWYGQHFGE